MSTDRAAMLREARALLRQGKLDQGIARYLRLVEKQPSDWNTANLLGDLYVRAGLLDPAIGQFSRIAENLRREGFLAKAAALYKKILKIKPDADDALMQAGELAAEQGLLAEARRFFTMAADGRRQRGDPEGAIEVAARIRGLNTADVEVIQADQAAVEASPGPITPGNPHAIDLDLVLGRPARDEVSTADSAGTASEPMDIEAVFEHLRGQAERTPSDGAASAAFTRGSVMFKVGETQLAIDELRRAAQSPRRRFAAAALLSRIHQEQGREREAIEWLRHSVDAPRLTHVERFDTLFRLADLLEHSGEPASALAACLELQSEAGDYRDLATRIARLLQASGG